MIKKPLSEEIFYYPFDGKEYSFIVEELEDGLWNISCAHELFRVVNGSNTLSRVSSVTEALEKMGNVHQSLARAMLEPFGKHCAEKVQSFCNWSRDRRMFNLFN